MQATQMGTTRSHWVEKAQAKLDEWDATVAKLQAKAEGMKADARGDYESAMNDAKRHLDHAKAQLRKAGQIGDETWDEVKDGFREAWETDKEAFQRAVAKLH